MRNQKGQTSLEYILMLAVAISLGVTFQKRMSEYFLHNPKSFIGGALSKFKAQFSGTEERNGRKYYYKNFRVIPAAPRRNR
jgi:hypothetical protein